MKMDLSPEDDFPGRLLHQAALWDNVELLEDLLRGSPGGHSHIESLDSCGRAPLHAAAVTADSRCLRILLNAGADVNKRCGTGADNRTALHMSVDHGHFANVKCLLEFGASLSDRDLAGMTALDIADRAGNKECMALLKDAADARVRARHEAHANLRVAVASGDETTAHSLLRALGPEAGIIVNMAPGGANTLLFTACQLGYLSIASLLLAHGADGRAHPVTRYSPLYTACHHGNTTVAKTLLRRFPELVQHTTMERWLPIHAGCINGHTAVVALLLRYQYPEHLMTSYNDASGRWEWRLAFNPNAQDVTGQTPLYVASLLGNKPLVELLLGWRVRAAKAQSDQDDSAETTPTSPAQTNISPTRRRISDGIQSIMSRLSLGRDAIQDNPQDTLISPLQLDVYCNNGRETALMSSVRGGHHEIAAALLVAGADPNLPVKGSTHHHDTDLAVRNEYIHVDESQSLGPYTPLVEAARQRALPLVELMLRHGARDDQCHALSVAAANQDEPIVARLLAIKAYPDPEFKINKRALGTKMVAESSAPLSSMANLTYSAMFPNTPTMVNWHNQRCHLSTIRAQWLSSAALHCNPRLKNHPKGSELALSALTRIDVSNNSLTSLPPVILQLCSLRYLNVSQNKIERFPTPSEITTPTSENKPLKKNNPKKTDYVCPVLEELYLQYNRLEFIPDAIFRLPSLITLDVSSNHLQSLPHAMWKAPALRELNASFNLLRELPTQDEFLSKDVDADSISVSSSDSRLSINELSNSESEPMDGSGNHQRHYSVTQVDLKKHHVWSRSLEITEQILHCEENMSKANSQISSLNLAHNQFTSIPVALPCLAVNLTRLNLSYNSLRSMSHVTSYPASLKQLDLSHNQISCWPSLPQVEAVDLMEMAHLACYCPIEGASIKPKGPSPGNRNSRSLRSCVLQSVCTHRRHLRLESLRTLVLADNLLPRIQLATDDDGGIACEEDDSDWGIVNAAKARLVFPNLSMLDVSNNCLKEIPSGIHELSNLSVLNVSGNSDVSELPAHMGLLSRLWNLNTRGCSLQEPLRSMIESKKYKTMDIIGYLKSVLEDARPYARMKLMIVGVQGIGKTSLLNQLRQEGAPHYRRKPVEHWAKRMGHKNMNVKTHRGTNMSTVGVDIGDWVYEKKIRGQSTHGPVVFRTWDFGGQKEYYATHQYFLSRRSLYLVVWRITDGRQGLTEILQWLVNIQARAPNSPVIIVGTHYDAIGETNPRASSSEELQQLIRERFINIVDAEKLGLPRVLDTIEVSCKTRHNVRLLCGIIYDTVFSLRPPGSKELLLEQRVPASYLALEDVVCGLAASLRAQGSDPVLSAEQYRTSVAQEMTTKYHRAFRDWAELNQATMFLHDNGVLLHYDDATLKDLYFLDPQWLCDVLAHVVTIREINPFARTGVMRLEDLKHLFKSSSLGPPDGRGYIVSLLNKFEVALTWDSRTLLIPSLLPNEEEHRPNQAVTVKIPLRSRGWAVRGKRASSCDMPFILSAPQTSTQKESQAPLYELTFKRRPHLSISRLLLMSYFPSGFWSRLITRVLADDAIVDIIRGFFPPPNEASEDPILARLLDVKAEWSLWQTGLRLRYGDVTIFRMREVLPSTPAPYRHLRIRLKQEGIWCDVDMLGSSILEIHFPVHELVARRPYPGDPSGVQDISMEPCMKSTAQLLALAVDHIDILLEDWYPTLGTRFVHTSEGRFLVTRLVPCPQCLLNGTNSNPAVPQHPSTSNHDNNLPHDLSEKLAHALSDPLPLLDRRSRKSQDSLGWSDGDSGVGHSGGSSRVPSVEGHPALATPLSPQEQTDKHPHYSWMVEECILAAYDNRQVVCPTHGDVRLDLIAPDTIFMDLSEKHLINPEDITRGALLGRGAFGFVFRATCKARGTKQLIDVAMKMLQPVQPGSRARQSAVIAYKAAQGKWERDPLQYACKAYCTARQELNILLALRHPNIVPLVGVCTQPLALVLDLAPQGALDASLRHYRRSGARLGPYCVQALVLQAARAIEYLHRQRIIYRDLKAENVLVWELPPPFSDHPDNPVHIKVADYGISRLTLPSGAKGFGGTEGFMAPEIMRYNGEEEYTEKVDCFSFGMFLYELITLRQPFEGHEAVKECILEGGRPPLTHREVQFPSYCLDLMVLCWAQQPKDRPSASQIVSIASAPEFTHLLDVCSLNHSAPVCGATASPLPGIYDETQSLWETWMLCANCRIDIVTGSHKGWHSHHSMALNDSSTSATHGLLGSILPSVIGGHSTVPGMQILGIGTPGALTARPTVACCVNNTIWVGDSIGQIHAYIAGDCTPLFTYALEADPLGHTPVACLLPIPSMQRVACALGNGRLFVLDSEAPPTSPTAGEGSFVLTELGSGETLHSLAAVFRENDTCELWCGQSTGAVGIFTIQDHVVSHHDVITHFSPPIPSPSLAVTQLQASGGHVWSYVYPGCVVYQWNVATRSIEHRLDCSKLVPCSESLKSIAIEEHLSPGRCQVTSLCILGEEAYIGTTWGCIVIAERDSLRPITIFRPFEEEVRAIIPLTPPTNHRRTDGSAHQCLEVASTPPLIATIGRGYRSLINRYTDQSQPVPASPASAAKPTEDPRTNHMHVLLWRAEHWAAT